MQNCIPATHCNMELQLSFNWVKSSQGNNLQLTEANNSYADAKKLLDHT